MNLSSTKCHHSDSERCSPRNVTDHSYKLALGLLLVIPFQKFLSLLFDWAYLSQLAQLLSYIDEVGVVLLLGLVSLEVCLGRRRFVESGFLILLLMLFFYFVVVSLAKGWSFGQAMFGAYDHLKLFLVYLAFRLVEFSQDGFFRIVKYYCRVAIVFAVVAVIAEIFAVVNGLGIGVFVSDQIRFGLYRVVSLAGIGSWNYLGVFGVLGLMLIISLKSFVFRHWKLCAILVFVMIVLTFSRQAWLGLSMVSVFYIFKNRPLYIVFLGSLFGLGGYFSGIGLGFLADYEVIIDSERYYRLFAFIEGVKVFEDNLFFGAGVGSFGGLASVLFDSPLYDHWPSYFVDGYLFKIRSIDQYWIGLLAEVGVIGFLFYLVLLVSVWLKSWPDKSANSNDYIRRVGFVLRCYMLVFILVGFFGGVNNPLVSFVFFGLFGAFVSMCSSRNKIL